MRSNVVSAEEYKKILKNMKRNSRQYRNKCGWWIDKESGKKYWMRSQWEANYAYYLQTLKRYNYIKDWSYEEDVFWFDNIKRGVRSYKPDFKIYFNDRIEYREVKGYMDNKSKTKLRRMSIYYPNVVINVVDSKAYHKIRKKSQYINGWDTPLIPNIDDIED